MYSMDEQKYKKYMMIWIAVTVVLVIGAFLMGSRHGQTVAKNTFAQSRGGAGMNGGRAGGRFGAGGGVVMGNVLTIDSTSMTVKLRDGSTKIVLYTGSTQVAKSVAGAISDVAVGSTISAIGTQNTDGSVTAQTVQIRPAMPAGNGAPSVGQAQ